MSDTPEVEHPGAVAPLLPLLREQLGLPRLTYAEPPHPVGGGFSNDIFRFRLEDAPPEFRGTLVLRLTHDDDETVREAVIQHGVAERGVAAPAVLIRGPSTSALGRPYVISPWMSGSAFDDLVRPRTAIGAFRRIAGQLAETMRAIHDVNTEEIRDQLAASGWSGDRLGSVAALDEVERHIADLEAPDLARGAARLRAEMPSFGQPVVCHGDLHPLNLLYDGNDVVAVLDWELARLADPAFDVARSAMLLRMAPYPMAKAVRVVVSPIAARLASSFIRRYRALRPLAEQSLRWHDALHCLRTLTMASLGARHSATPRLRRLADVWLPVAPRLRSRFSQVVSSL
jgi:aminoglycoside phosphotransferase (APT) family kinase protein